MKHIRKILTYENLKILQINIRGIRSNNHELYNTIQKNKIDIALIQETWLKNNDLPPNLDKYV